MFIGTETLVTQLVSNNSVLEEELRLVEEHKKAGEVLRTDSRNAAHYPDAERNYIQGLELCRSAHTRPRGTTYKCLKASCPLISTYDRALGTCTWGRSGEAHLLTFEEALTAMRGMIRILWCRLVQVRLGTSARLTTLARVLNATGQAHLKSRLAKPREAQRSIKTRSSRRWLCCRRLFRSSAH